MGRYSNAVVGTDRPGGALSFLLTGRPNIGKTFFASTIPNLFFVPVENGLKGTSPDHEVHRATDPNGDDIVPSNFNELLEGIDYFRSIAKQKGYRHLCIDSMTGVEKLINRQVCNQERVAHMEAKEFKEVWWAASPLWERFKSRLEAIQHDGINYWIIAHSSEVDETDSGGMIFKKWDLHFEGTGKVLINMRNDWRRSVDTVLFMDWDSTVKAGKVMTSKAVGVYKSRVLYTRESPRHFAKNRSGLPAMLPATWDDLSKALRAGTPANADRLRAQIDVAMRELNDANRAAVAADLAAAKTATQLSSVLSRANGLASVQREEALDDGQARDDNAIDQSDATTPQQAFDHEPATPARDIIATVRNSISAATNEEELTEMCQHYAKQGGVDRDALAALYRERKAALAKVA